MSRIGLRPVELPAGVEVTVGENNLVTVKGPQGQLQEQLSSLITIEVKENVVTVSRDSDVKEKRAQHGLARTLIANMVEGDIGNIIKDFHKKTQWFLKKEI